MVETRIKNILSKLFSIPMETINEETSPDNVVKWDSVGHMNLVVSLEEEFNIRFNETQIIEMLSYPLIVLTIKDALSTT